MAKILRVTGFFFQKGIRLGFGFDDDGERIPGVVALITATEFLGAIYISEEEAGGDLFDILEHGRGRNEPGVDASSLSEIKLTDEEFSFVKTYKDGKPPVQYSYRKHPDSNDKVSPWKGEWVIEADDESGEERGPTNCMLVEMPEWLYEAPKDYDWPEGA
ncbi:hypothetical protein HYV44_00165 [Candidatus Microgenomates bacterium]|nr:hypothetical protein [Candidatus Microgenomates bacterium]